MEPVLDRAIIIDNNFRGTCKENLESAYDDIFIMKVRSSLLAFVLAACSEHASGRSVVGASDNFTKEAELAGSNHILYTWNTIEHLSDFLVVNVFVFNIQDGNVEDATYAAVKKYFKAAKKGFL